jgi:hypothetical protein
MPTAPGQRNGTIVGNVEEVLSFYGRIFSFMLRGRWQGAALIDMGDQFIAPMEGPARRAATAMSGWL